MGIFNLCEPKEEFERLWKKHTRWGRNIVEKDGEGAKIPWHREEVKECYLFFCKGFEYKKW